MASEPQALDTIQLIRRKRTQETDQELQERVPQPILEHALPATTEVVKDQGAGEAGALRMKPRETVQLAAVHVRIPEQLARGLRLMSVLEGRQAQVIVAEMLEEHLTKWNPKWKDSVPSRGG